MTEEWRSVDSFPGYFVSNMGRVRPTGGRIKPLDVLAENAEGSLLNDDERFDSDLSLCGGEMSRLVTDLVGALGGEKANA